MRASLVFIRTFQYIDFISMPVADKLYSQILGMMQVFEIHYTIGIDSALDIVIQCFSTISFLIIPLIVKVIYLCQMF